MNMTPEDLNKALKNLLFPLQRPLPPGISLYEAIKVNLMHDILHQRHYANTIISKTYIVSYIDIVYDVVFNIVFIL